MTNLSPLQQNPPSFFMRVGFLAPYKEAPREGATHYDAASLLSAQQGKPLAGPLSSRSLQHSDQGNMRAKPPMPLPPLLSVGQVLSKAFSLMESIPSAFSHKPPLFPALCPIYMQQQQQSPRCSLSKPKPCQQSLAGMRVLCVLALQKYLFPL